MFKNLLNNIIKKSKDKFEQTIDESKGKVLAEIDKGKQNLSNSINNVLPQKKFETIDSDILSLLWIKNGKYKNINKFKIRDIFYQEYGSFLNDFSDEPSLIDFNLPINFKEENLDWLGYFPSYDKLNANQRGKYINYLQNPFKKLEEIGYAFIYYYGLERFYFTDNYEKAIITAGKLRAANTNRSFSNYSANGIILACLMNGREDLLANFLDMAYKNNNLNMSVNLYLTAKSKLNSKLTPKEIISFSKSFGFKKHNYIKKYPELFEENLTIILIEKYEHEGLDINSIFLTNDSNKSSEKLTMLANISLPPIKIEIIDFINDSHFINILNEILLETHELVKIKLQLMRQEGIVLKVSEENVKKKSLKFDEEKEKEILKRYKIANNQIDKHFLLNELIDFYYKYRDLDDKYLLLTMDYCYKNIENIDLLIKEYNKKEAKYLMKTNNQKNNEIPLPYSISSFKRLAIIYEKEKEFIKALEITERAIEYYKYTKRKEELKDFLKRKERLLERINR